VIKYCRFLVVLGVAVLLVLQICAQGQNSSSEALDHFEKKVRPLLVAKCYACHSLEKNKSKGGLTLDSQDGWKQGGENGPAVVPGKPDESLLIKAVRYTDESLKMPPKSHGGRLKNTEIADLEKWVRQGASDPRHKTEPSGSGAELRGTWWAFQPLRAPSIPSLQGKTPRNPIDAFLETKWMERGIQSTLPANRRMLLRRATFDLTGLPPTREEIEAFLADKSDHAFDRVIGRLLESPHYGEKWGRHWLDVVRYADSLDDRSYDKDGDILDAWRYRDWVVQAFNQDLPYDQFIVQQLAGDILAAQPGKWNKSSMIATGMYAIGNWGNGDADKEKVHTDIVDDQIDVTSRAFLGVTLACARCHDHKFDPFTARDYYGMAGFFFSSHILDRFQSKGEGEKLMRIPLQSPEEKAHQVQVAKRLAEIDKRLSKSLRPMDEFKNDVAGIPGLRAWVKKGSENPSLVINPSAQPVSFGTIKMGPRTIALHPGPKVPASAVWRSPVAGTVLIQAQLKDADPNCGDGISWEIAKGSQTLKKGEMKNGGTAAVAEFSCALQAGELLRLSIGPRNEYTCDTTEVDFIIRSKQGQKWDLRQTLVQGGSQGQDQLWWICSGEGEKLATEDQAMQQLETESKRLSAEKNRQDFAQGMLEGGIAATNYAGFHDARVHLRGSYNRLGEMVPRSVPAVLCQAQPKIGSGSGRLELAQWIASAHNPLTARVMVNRIWQHHFGEGLVRTANNFGKLGTPPTHPALLDFLAQEFIRSGWSIKAMHRLIMTSEVYRLSSLWKIPEHAENDSVKLASASRMSDQDPDNLLLARQNRRRLDAEEVRDAMLYVSGELDLTLGGKAIRDLNSKRRTLYVTTIRSDRSNFQALFDAADPTAIVEKRTEATVSPQALWLLNHPFVLERARQLARRVAAHSGDRQAKMIWLCELLFARPADSFDQALAEKSVQRHDQAADWERLCQVLLCSNEFIYVD
jgi:hypothetical protein